VVAFYVINNGSTNIIKHISNIPYRFYRKFACRVNKPHGIIVAKSVWTDVVVFFAQRIGRSPKGSRRVVQPCAVIVKVKSVFAVEIFSAILVRLETGSRTDISPSPSPGIVKVLLQNISVLVRHGAHAAQTVAHKVTVFRHSRGKIAEPAVEKELVQPPVPANKRSEKLLGVYHRRLHRHGTFSRPQIRRSAPPFRLEFLPRSRVCERRMVSVVESNLFGRSPIGIRYGHPLVGVAHKPSVSVVSVFAASAPVLEIERPRIGEVYSPVGN